MIHFQLCVFVHSVDSVVLHISHTLFLVKYFLAACYASLCYSLRSLSQMATPSLKTRMAWCRSPMSSERTTPPNRGPTSGEPPPAPSRHGRTYPEPRQPFSNGDLKQMRGRARWCERVPPAWGHFFGHEKMKRDRGRWCHVVFEKGKTKQKTRNKTLLKTCRLCCSCVSSRHDEPCAFLAVCGPKFFTVLAQFVRAIRLLPTDLRKDTLKHWAKKIVSNHFYRIEIETPETL